jgi:hypothetical protein
MSTVVTLAGLYYGKTTCSKVIAARKLLLSNNISNTK